MGDAESGIPRQRSSKGRRDNGTALFMLAPALILLGIFVIWPVINAGYRSFFNWSFYTESEFVGLQNFRNVLDDPAFFGSLVRGVRFALLVVPPLLIIAFVFASLVKALSQRVSSVLKISIYIPAVISSAIASIVFTLIYAYRGGVANWLLELVGVAPVAWLNNPSTALIAIAIPAIWMALGLTSLIMLAGLLDIPENYYEAASIEGANWWQKSRYITLPLLRNTFIYLLITNTTLAIQQYELPLIMTDGGPLESTLLPNLFIFNHFRNDLYVGYSIAAAFLLFIVVGAISALIFRMFSSEKALDS